MDYQTRKVRPVTRDEVARRAGVSSATVSYVINDGPRHVTDETRCRVLDVIRELDYRPSGVARNLRLQRTSFLGLIIPDTSNPYFAEVTRGIEQVAFEQGYTLNLCHSGYDSKRELDYVEMLNTQRVAGVIWVPAQDNFEPFHRLSTYGIPTVTIDRTVPGVEATAILADNFRGGYLATRHLVELGHRRIGCISRPVVLSHSQARLRGYLKVLEEAGIPEDPELIVRGGFRLEDGYKALVHLLGLESPPTALFAYNDMMAIGALRALHDYGKRVPEDFSLVGYDDIAPAAYSIPSLTTVCMPKFEIGREGARLLLSMIQGLSLQDEMVKPLPVNLVVRESTGPVKLS